MITPDVLTHFFLGMSLAVLVYGIRLTPGSVLLILGSLLPDIERPITWILNIANIQVLSLTSLSHSILGVIVLSYAASACFKVTDQTFNKRFSLILTGSLVHLAADLTMYQWSELGIYLLYPLKIPFSFHLVWPDYPLFPIYGFMIFIAALVVSVIFRQILERKIEA